jgi:hypothetical protein
MVYFAAPDGYLVALDARNGTVRWQTKAHDYNDGTEHTGGLMVADGKLLSNRACKVRAGCFIAAHDAKSGEELWKFYNTPAPGEPGGESWGDLPAALVGRNGSIDWLCWPRFDSNALFAALLGTSEHGRWRIFPADPAPRVSRAYHRDTLVLETIFDTADGRVALIDFMPIGGASSSVIRLVTPRQDGDAIASGAALRLWHHRAVGDAAT